VAEEPYPSYCHPRVMLISGVHHAHDEGTETQYWKELIDCRYSRKAPASSRCFQHERHESLGFIHSGSDPKRGRYFVFLVLNSKRLTGKARAGGVLASSAVVAAAAASLPASAWGAGSRDWDSSGGPCLLPTDKAAGQRRGDFGV